MSAGFFRLIPSNRNVRLPVSIRDTSSASVSNSVCRLLLVVLLLGNRAMQRAFFLRPVTLWLLFASGSERSGPLYNRPV